MVLVRRAGTVAVILALVLASFIVGRASERETAITVQVSSADHEVVEGYFSLGDSATLMVKPGTDLYRFLVSRRGHQVRVTLTEADRAELSRIAR
jgi:hypothetical protein